MKATGIVRRIDDLGRVVIPKEIRRTMRIREGDPMEIYTNADGAVIFKKYSPIGELSNYAAQYAEVLYKTGGLPALVCDRDNVIAVSGVPKKELLERRVAPELEELMAGRKTLPGGGKSASIKPVEGVERFAYVCYPILSQGDVNGAVMFISGEQEYTPTETQIKLIQAAAALLGKQIEE